VDPLTAVPSELSRGFRAVLQGVVGVIVSYVTTTVRGYESYSSNEFVHASLKRGNAGGSLQDRIELVARLHNDDVHTFDEVIQALTNCGLDYSSSTRITTAVDREGEGLIYRGFPGPELVRYSRIVSDEAKLLFSIVPVKAATMEPRISAAFAWFLSLGHNSDGLRRIITESLLTEVERLPSHASASPEMGAPAPDAIFAEAPTEGRAYNGEDSIRQFPYSIQYLRSPPRRLDADPAAADRFVFPFDYCHRNSLAVVIMSTPFLPPALKKAVNDMLIVYQQDILFKNSFSQVLTILYPALCTLFCRSIGTSENNIFSTTVQLYTADSVVTMMSSDGVAMRPLPEGEGWGESGSEPVFITKMLTSTLLAILSDTGLVADRANDDFVSHHTVRTRRYSHLCRDIEYIADNCAGALRLLSGDRDPGTVSCSH
jgi:hypothetical protein